MSWVVRLADDAQKFVDGLPNKARRQLSRSIDQMEHDPFQGNVKALQGKAWKGFYRKRTGDYRIIFTTHQQKDQQFVDIVWVGLKSEKTYG
jgi:mRNA-degrading endonuclease RelE of RelBE toxin-antitoxin system